MSACHAVLITTIFVTSVNVANAAAPAVQFDAPLSVALTPAKLGDNTLHCKFRISSLIKTPNAPRIDQWIVTCKPQDTSMRIIDYSPSTTVSSGIEGPIEFKVTSEASRSFGGSIDGNYGKLLHGHLGADQGSKVTESKQYRQVAPSSAVIASGTIQRGRGVYFKLRWTAQQVLEGEKEFEITFAVPKAWRTGMIDVNVAAQTSQSRFGGLDRETKVVGQNQFTLPVYRSGDRKAAHVANQIALTESSLRDSAGDAARSNSPTSLPGMIRHVAARLDLDQSTPLPRSNGWLKRLLAGQADPYTDSEISGLPIHIRVAAIDFHDARNQFKQLAMQNDRHAD